MLELTEIYISVRRTVPSCFVKDIIINPVYTSALNVKFLWLFLPTILWADRNGAGLNVHRTPEWDVLIVFMQKVAGPTF